MEFDGLKLKSRVEVSWPEVDMMRSGGASSVVAKGVLTSPTNQAFFLFTPFMACAALGLWHS